MEDFINYEESDDLQALAHQLELEHRRFIEELEEAADEREHSKFKNESSAG